MELHLTEDNIDALTLGVASDEETATWRAHLAQCPACRRTFQAAMSALEAVEEIEIPEMAPDRWERLTRESLKSLSPRAQRQMLQTHRRPTFSLGGWSWRLAALAAAFVIVVVMVSVRRDDAWRSSPSAMDRSLQGNDSTRDLAQGLLPAASTTSTASQTLSGDFPQVSADDSDTIGPIRPVRFPVAIQPSQKSSTQQVVREEWDSC